MQNKKSTLDSAIRIRDKWLRQKIKENTKTKSSIKLKVITETEFTIKKLKNKEIVVMCNLRVFAKDKSFADIGWASSEEPQIKKYKSFDKVMIMLIDTSKKRAYRNVKNYLRR